MNQIGLTVRRRLALPVGGLALLGVLATLWATAPVASAATTVCSNTAQYPLYGNVNGNVSVPAGDTCYLDATVNGSVSAAAGSKLVVYGVSTISGSLTTIGASYVSVAGTHVSGATQINLEPTGIAVLESSTFSTLTVTGGDDVGVSYNHISGSATVANAYAGGNNKDCNCVDIETNHIGGALHVTGNAAPIFVEYNSVGGPVSITNNTGGTFSVYGGGISYNSSGGALSCSGNGTPFEGGGNSASVKTGQCSAF